MSRKKELTVKEIFDLVAPIHIYFNADVCFKEKAKKAFKILAKHEGEDNVEEYFWFDFDDYDENSICQTSWQAYNELFMIIVQNILGEKVSFDYDKWGAREVRKDGKYLFAGDGFDEFPLYENSDLLIKDLNEFCI